MSPLAAPPPGADAVAGWGWPQNVALIVPIIAALGAVIVWSLGQRARRREQRSKSFAAALASVEAYAEMPYRIRRRPDTLEARPELTEAISAVQADIAWHQAWLELEAPTVAGPYRALVRAAREQAGAQMRQAWTHPPLHADHEMNLHIAYPREQIDASRVTCLQAMAHAQKWRPLPTQPSGG